jgi:hypothetical protein
MMQVPYRYRFRLHSCLLCDRCTVLIWYLRKLNKKSETGMCSAYIEYICYLYDVRMVSGVQFASPMKPEGAYKMTEGSQCFCLICKFSVYFVCVGLH